MTKPIVYRDAAIKQLRKIVGGGLWDVDDDITPTDVTPVSGDNYYTRYDFTNLANTDYFTWDYLYLDLFSNGDIKINISATSAQKLASRNTYAMVSSTYLSSNTGIDLLEYKETVGEKEILMFAVGLNQSGLTWEHRFTIPVTSGEPLVYVSLIPASSASGVIISAEVPATRISVNESSLKEYGYDCTTVAKSSAAADYWTINRIRLVTRSYDPQYLRVEYNVTGTSKSSEKAAVLIESSYFSNTELSHPALPTYEPSDDNVTLIYTVNGIKIKGENTFNKTLYSGSVVIMAPFDQTWGLSTDEMPTSDKGADAVTITQLSTAFTRYNIANSNLNVSNVLNINYMYLDVYDTDVMRLHLSLTAKTDFSNTSYETFGIAEGVTASEQLTLCGPDNFLYIDDSNIWLTNNQDIQSGTTVIVSCEIPDTVTNNITIGTDVPILTNTEEGTVTETEYTYSLASTANSCSLSNNLVWNKLHITTRSYDSAYLRIEYEITPNNEFNAESADIVIPATTLVNENACGDSTQCRSDSTVYFTYKPSLGLLLQTTEGLEAGTTYTGGNVILAPAGYSWSVKSPTLLKTTALKTSAPGPTTTNMSTKIVNTLTLLSESVASLQSRISAIENHE